MDEKRMCTVCNRTFENLKALTKHARVHIGYDVCVRPSCSEVYRKLEEKSHRTSHISCRSRSSTAQNTTKVESTLGINLDIESKYALYTPSLILLASVDLEPEIFYQFVAEGSNALGSFVESLASIEIDGYDTDDKKRFSELREKLSEIVEVHEEFLKSVPNMPPTMKYTDLMLSSQIDTDKTMIVAHTFGAISPFMKLYAYLGKNLHPFLHETHPYKGWIEAYHCDSFQVSADKSEKLLDKVSSLLNNDQFVVIEKVCLQAVELLLEVFTKSIPRSLKHSKCGLVIFFDIDTMCESSHGWDDPSDFESVLFEEKGYKSDYDRLCTVLAQLSDSEKILNCPLQQFEDFSLQDIVLHDDCRDFFQTIGKKSDLDADFPILSCCWCGDLIKASFRYDAVDVLEYDSFTDKLDKMNVVLERANRDIAIYVGCSVGDISCLLKADLGIVMGDYSSAQLVGERCGISFLPLYHAVVAWCHEGSLKKHSKESQCGVLYTVSSWAELTAFVIALNKIGIVSGNTHNFGFRRTANNVGNTAVAVESNSEEKKGSC